MVDSYFVALKAFSSLDNFLANTFSPHLTAPS